MVRPFPLLPFLLVLTVLGCLEIDDFPQLELEESSPRLAFPLLQASVLTDDMIDLLADSVSIFLNENGIYTALFEAESFVRTKADLLPPISPGLPIPITDTVVVLPFTSIDSFNLTYFILKGNRIFFVLNTDAVEDVMVTLSIVPLERQGIPFSFTYRIPYSGDKTSTLVTQPIDLNGFEARISNEPIALEYQAQLEDGNSIPLLLSFAQIDAVDFAYIEGTISSTSVFSTEQVLTLDLQNRFVDGEFAFQNPVIHFDVSNSFGLPIAAILRALYVVDSRGTEALLQSDLVNQPIELGFPSLQEIGLTRVARFTFDKSNSNILEIAESDVREIRYELDLLLNPSGDSDQPFFITDSSEVNLQVEAELEFDAFVKSIDLEWLLEVSIPEIDSLEEARLKMVIDNGIPLQFTPQLIFENGQTGDSLLWRSDELGVSIASATVDSFGEVTASSRTISFYTLSREDIVILRSADKLKAFFELVSPRDGSHPARIRPRQQLDLMLGMEAKLR
ncbi:MAG: hypothetical protein OEQ53_09895 [Saprospiraceae bacterium]|nr:hypothetical protein [Saprospiraceae bacterium]